VGTAARTLAAIHHCPPPGGGLPVRDLALERTATERDLVLLASVWPDVADRLREGAEQALDTPAGVRTATRDGWPGDPVLAHGDFTPGQVLLDPADPAGRAGLVDVDTLCIAEPALDLGRFLAYLHVTGIRRSGEAWPLLADLSAHFLATYLEAGALAAGSATGTDARRRLLERTSAYRTLALARLGASACWQLKDDRLRAVVDVLDAGDEWRRNVPG
jgi:aminoglycoside phosphotransferase (APT) family kinase protein